MVRQLFLCMEQYFFRDFMKYLKKTEYFGTRSLKLSHMICLMEKFVWWWVWHHKNGFIKTLPTRLSAIALYKYQNHNVKIIKNKLIY